MKITIKVRPGARMNKIELTADGAYNVWVTAHAHDGEANDALRELLADHFDTSKSRITLVKGHTSRHKVFEVGS